MSLRQTCPSCGASLPADRLSGLCPACAWNGLFGPEDAAEPPALPRARPAFADMPPPLMRIAGYELLEEIARGGMGIVYRARQLEPRRTVALKMLLPHQLGSKEQAERFRLEVRALTELEHPNILPVHQMAEHDGLPFFTMKLATGGTLAQRKGQYAGKWREIARLLAILADAVQFAHERGVLHRDLKPGNILFDEQDHPYVSDFGLAKLANTDAELTQSADFLGTPTYVAPEIATRSARHATTASDLYSLGAILYELLTGRPPFEAESIPALLRRIVEEDPPRPSAARSRLQTPDSKCEPVPRDLEVICLKCLAREPERRYESARAFREDLERWLEGRAILARPVTAVERAYKWMRRNPVLATLAAALLISLAGVAFSLLRSDREVRKALSATRQAEGQARQNLRAALLAQAKALGAANATGQRWAALEALATAARIQPSLELRNEAAAALARPDLREINRFPANIGAGGSSSVAFTSQLESYVEAEPNGFALRRTKDQNVIASFPDPEAKPARWFVISPDDRQVAAVLNNYKLEIWPLDGATPAHTWQGNIRQPAIAEFHPDAVTIAGFIPGEGAFLQYGDNRRPLQSTNGRAIFMRFDSAGEHLAIVRDPGGVEVWNCGPRLSLRWCQPMTQTVPWVAWSPDGRKLAAAANDGRGLRIFSATTGQTELVYSGHLLYPRQFEFDPSGQMVCSTGDDWSLRLWDARTGQDLVCNVGRHRVMRFSQDGRWLSTAPSDRELAILELAPQEVFREFRSSPSDPSLPSKVTRTRDGRFLLSANPQLRIFDTVRAEEIATLNLPARLKQAFFEKDGSAVYYSIYGQGIYRREFRWDSHTVGTSGFQWGEEKLVAKHPAGIVWKVLDERQAWVYQATNHLEIWPNRAPDHARRLPIRAALQYLEASENGRWIAAPDRVRGDRAIVWDAQTGDVVTNLPAPATDHVWFSPDSRWIVAAVENGYRTWETGTWRAGASWTAHLDSGDPGEISFSDDGRLVAARQERETFQVLSFPDCKELVTLRPPLVIHMQSACLSGDGRRLWLMAAGYRLFEWNLGPLRTELARLGLDWQER